MSSVLYIIPTLYRVCAMLSAVATLPSRQICYRAEVYEISLADNL